MDLMAKKRVKPVEQPAPDSGDGKAQLTPFRAVDPNLIRQIDAWARENRRSRNMAINLLLEFALSQKGFWPAPE